MLNKEKATTRPETPGTARKLLGTVRLKLANRTISKLIRRGGRRPEDLVAATQAWVLIAEEICGKDSMQAMSASRMLGMAYREAGDPRAATTLQGALSQLKNVLGSSHPLVAVVLNDLAAVCHIMGQEKEAEQHYRQALAIDCHAYGIDHPEVVTDMSNLGSFLFARRDRTPEHLQEARALFDRVLEMDRKVLPPSDPGHVMDHLNLSGLLRAEGDYDGAEGALRQGIELLERHHPHLTIKLAQALSSLANILVGQGRFAEAGGLLERALVIQEEVQGSRHPDLAGDLNVLALLRCREGNHLESLELLERSARLRGRIIGQVSAIAAEAQRLDFAYQSHAEVEFFLSLTLRLRAEGRQEEIRRRASRLAADVLIQRKAWALEALTVQREAVFEKRHPELAERFAQLIALKRQIVRHLFQQVIDTVELRRLEAEKVRLESRLAESIPEMDLELRLRVADSSAILAALEPGAMLVEFVHASPMDFDAVPARGEPLQKPARYYALVLRSDFAPEWVELERVDVVDRAADRFVGRLGSGNSDPRHLMPTVESSGEATPVDELLREALFEPWREMIGDRRNLFLVLDGNLAKVPFGLLPHGEGYLLDRYRFSYLNTARDLLRLDHSVQASDEPCVVIADPAFDLVDRSTSDGTRSSEDATPGRRSRHLDRDSLRFAPLPGSRKEGETISRMLNVDPWLGESAREGRIKAHRAPRILHMATHAYYLPPASDQQVSSSGPAGHLGGLESLPARDAENPLLRSALVLAGVNSWLAGRDLPPDAEDGFLTAEDASGLDLSGTDLVVLSACETGLGDVRPGEGVFGLQRAFISAGARTLVMSLWKVPDEATRHLMVAFYEGILSGRPRADALREAQRRIREREPDPRNWGAFVCLGDPGPLLEPGMPRSDAGEINPPAQFSETFDHRDLSPSVHRASFGLARFLGFLGFMVAGLTALRQGASASGRELERMVDVTAADLPLVLLSLLVGLIGLALGQVLGLQIPVRNPRIGRALDLGWHYGASSLIVWVLVAIPVLGLALGVQESQKLFATASHELALSTVVVALLLGWTAALVVHPVFSSLVKRGRVVAAGAGVTLGPWILWTAGCALWFAYWSAHPFWGCLAGFLCSLCLIPWCEHLISADRRRRIAIAAHALERHTAATVGGG